jgi:hypothetical protein
MVNGHTVPTDQNRATVKGFARRLIRDRTRAHRLQYLLEVMADKSTADGFCRHGVGTFAADKPIAALAVEGDRGLLHLGSTQNKL